MLRKTLMLAILYSVTLLTACQNTAQKAEEDHHGEAEAAEQGEAFDQVHISARQAETLGIELGHLENKPLKNLIKANGVLKLPPQNQADVSALMDGRIREIRVVEGDAVRKGQTLVLVEQPDFIQLQQDYLEAVNHLAFLEKELERQKNLAAENLGAARELQQIENEYRTEKSQKEALKQKLALFGVSPEKLERGEFTAVMPILSPIDGAVRAIHVNVGGFVEAMDTILEVVDNRHLHLDLHVYETDLPKIKLKQKVYFTLPNQNSGEMQAEIFAIGKALEPETKSVIVHADMRNRVDALLPGMYVSGYIALSEAEAVAAVPDEAIVREGNLAYIFVHVEEGEAHKEEAHAHEGEAHKDEALDDHAHAGEEMAFKLAGVKTGASGGGFTEVVLFADLQEHVEIVVKNAYYLLAELRKGEGGGDAHAQH